MAERLNRDPSFDIAERIRTGVKPPSSGDPVIQKYDAELDRNDPMIPSTAGHGNNFYESPTADAVIMAVADSVLGLSQREIGTNHDDGRSFVVDVATASNCLDEPTKGGIAYGPRNTGGS